MELLLQSQAVEQPSFVQRLLWKPVLRSLELSPVAGWRIKYQHSEKARVKLIEPPLPPYFQSARYLEHGICKSGSWIPTRISKLLRAIVQALTQSSERSADTFLPTKFWSGAVSCSWWSTHSLRKFEDLTPTKIQNFKLLGGKHFKGEKCSVKC